MTSFTRCALWIGFAALPLMTQNVQAQDVKLPDGEGKALVQKICGNCHGIDTAVADTRTAAGWRSIVDTMINRGAEGSDTEFDTIVKYLTKNYGKDPASAPKQ